MRKISMVVTASLLTLAATTASAADYYDTRLLTAKDVQLYLRIMHKAADQADAFRAHHRPCPPPIEIKPGRAYTDAEMAAIANAATCMANSEMVSMTDDTVAQQDGAEPHYGEVKNAIESLIQPNPTARDGVGPVISAGICPESWGCMPPGFTKQQQAYWEMQDKFRSDNNKFLQPYRPEIQRLETRVRRIGEEQPNPLAPPTGRQPAPYQPPARRH